MAEEGSRKQRVAGLIHQKFTSSKYHPVELVPGHVSTREIRKNISRNAHYVRALKNQRDQLGMRNLLLQAFLTCWQDMIDVYQKSDRTTIPVHGPAFSSRQ